MPMTIFYLIFVALAIYFSIRYDGIEEHDSHKQHRLWLMCAYMVCLTGFSYGLGADKFAYMNEFDYYPSSFSDAKEYILVGLFVRGQMPLWTIVNIICRALFDSFYAVQLLESAAINIAVCYIVSKYTHRCFLFLLIYFLSLQYFIFNTEVMREGFALSLTLIGMDGWLSGRKWLYFVTFPIALMCHVSACAALLFPFAVFRISWKTLGLALFASFVLWAISDKIMGQLIAMTSGGVDAVSTKVKYYGLETVSVFSLVWRLLKYLIFPFVIMYTATLLEANEAKRRCKERMALFMVYLAIVSSAIPGLVRFYNYCMIFYLLTMADFVFKLFYTEKHLLIRMGTMAGTLFFILQLYFGRYTSTNTFFYEFFYPYTCILDESAKVDFRPAAHFEATQHTVDDKKIRNIN